MYNCCCIRAQNRPKKLCSNLCTYRHKNKHVISFILIGPVHKDFNFWYTKLIQICEFCWRSKFAKVRQVNFKFSLSDNQNQLYLLMNMVRHGLFGVDLSGLVLVVLGWRRFLLSLTFSFMDQVREVVVVVIKRRGPNPEPCQFRPCVTQEFPKCQVSYLLCKHVCIQLLH